MDCLTVAVEGNSRRLDQMVAKDFLDAKLDALKAELLLAIQQSREAIEKASTGGSAHGKAFQSVPPDER